MTQAQATAGRIRWIMLAAAIVCWSAGLFLLLGGVYEHGVGYGLMGVFGYDLSGWGPIAIFLGVFIIMQWLFLMPRRGWTIELGKTGRPMSTAISTAGLMAALLSMGLIAAVLELPGWWMTLLGAEGPRMQMEVDRRWVGPAIVGGLWLIWAVIFFMYWRDGQTDRHTRLSRLLRGLIAGSVVELIICVPVHIAVLNKPDDDCYCVRGSYTGLVFGGTVLCWAFGPGVILLFARERVRRAQLLGNRANSEMAG